MDPNTANSTPSEMLRGEHRVIERVLGVLSGLVDRAGRGEGLETDSLSRCVEVFRHYADACHHAKEEDLLFPVLEARGVPREGGPIGVMLHEHTIARQLTKDMGEALADFSGGKGEAAERFCQTAGQYIELLRNHIHKEDNILFAMGDRVMSDEDQAALTDKFCAVDSGLFGGRRREEFERIADELERQ
ncbi:MAG: hemerythrin domain-containing protein [Planctomycetota bacterium]|jgi:hemerythrin-like domain-containing protein